MPCAFNVPFAGSCLCQCRPPPSSHTMPCRGHAPYLRHEDGADENSVPKYLEWAHIACHALGFTGRSPPPGQREPLGFVLTLCLAFEARQGFVSNERKSEGYPSVIQVLHLPVKSMQLFSWHSQTVGRAPFFWLRLRLSSGVM